MTFEYAVDTRVQVDQGMTDLGESLSIARTPTTEVVHALEIVPLETRARTNFSSVISK